MSYQRRTYTVTYERDEAGWWVATANELVGCHTQGRSIAQARERIREAMALCDVPRTAKLKEQIRIGGRLDVDLEDLRLTREQAERMARESAERTKLVAARLAKAGLSRRDVGELLGVSFQRVQQLVK